MKLVENPRKMKSFVLGNKAKKVDFSAPNTFHAPSPLFEILFQPLKNLILTVQRNLDKIQW